MVPTLPTLATISRVYGVGMSYFFAEPAKHTLSITRKAHLAGNSRGLESVKTTPLNTVADGTRLVARVNRVPAGGALSATDVGRGASGLVYVLEGKCSWMWAACTNCWRPAIAPAWKARWRWPGARPESTAAGFWR